MHISQLYIYPIKSLRGVSVPSMPLTEHGFPYDRRFMLLKVHHDGASTRYENMHVATFAEMCLFTTSLELPEEGGEASITVTYTSPKHGAKSTLKVPLTPDTTDLQTLDVSMHQSQTTALSMPDSYNAWFSARFGFDVVFAYLGTTYRPVLGNIAPNAATRNPIRRAMLEKRQNAASTTTSWLSGLVNSLPGLPTVFTEGEEGGVQDEDYAITFADCSPYLIVSQTSLENVSSRLPDGVNMDITKFRPNIIIDGAEEAFDEDFWGEVAVRSPDRNGENLRLQLTSNCVRCTSINVDYATGKFGTGPGGQVLKSLQRDRRVDSGHKYGPVFGRYAFLPHEFSSSKESLNIGCGDAVEITKRNESRTVLRWPGLGQTPKSELYPI